MSGILAYLALPRVAKILDIWACSDYCSALVVNSALIKKKIILDFSKFFRLKIGDFCVLGGFWVFFFLSIQQTKFIQEHVLIIIFRFSSKFCFYQHQTRKI